MAQPKPKKTEKILKTEVTPAQGAENRRIRQSCARALAGRCGGPWGCGCQAITLEGAGA
jgi:hypothetical protein